MLALITNISTVGRALCLSGIDVDNHWEPVVIFSEITCKIFRKRVSLFTEKGDDFNRNNHINKYMNWYRTSRIKSTLGGLSPLEYRRRIGVGV